MSRNPFQISHLRITVVHRHSTLNWTCVRGWFALLKTPNWRRHETIRGIEKPFLEIYMDTGTGSLHVFGFVPE